MLVPAIASAAITSAKFRSMQSSGVLSHAWQTWHFSPALVAKLHRNRVGFPRLPFTFGPFGGRVARWDRQSDMPSTVQLPKRVYGAWPVRFQSQAVIAGVLRKARRTTLRAGQSGDLPGCQCRATVPRRAQTTAAATVWVCQPCRVRPRGNAAESGAFLNRRMPDPEAQPKLPGK